MKPLNTLYVQATCRLWRPGLPAVGHSGAATHPESDDV